MLIEAVVVLASALVKPFEEPVVEHNSDRRLASMNFGTGKDHALAGCIAAGSCPGRVVYSSVVV